MPDCSRCGYATVSWHKNALDGGKIITHITCQCGETVEKDHICDRWHSPIVNDSELNKKMKAAILRFEPYAPGTYPGWKNPIPFKTNYRPVKKG